MGYETTGITVVFVFLIAIAASIVQSICGFGFAIIAMTFWPIFLPFRVASVLEVITAFFLVAYIAIRLHKFIAYRILFPCLITAGFCSFLGISTLMKLDEVVLQKILGIALLVLALYFIFFSERVHLKGNLWTGLLAGLISGFCGGLFNIGGPPMVTYLISVIQDKRVYTATLQAFFFINTITIFFIHLFQGNVSFHMMPLFGSALAGTVVGTGIGFFLFQRITMKGIKKIVYVFMLIAGTYLVIANGIM